MKTPRVIYALPIPPKLYARICRFARREEISYAEQMRRYLEIGVREDERRAVLDRQFAATMRKTP